MKKIKKILNNDGVISINVIIAMLTAVIFIMGAISFIAKTMAINEIQGKMDNAGIIALRSGVDQEKWRMEVFYVEKSIARTEFRKIMKNQIKTGNRSLIKEYNISEVNIYGPGDSLPRSLGIGGGSSKDQYFLESVISAKFKADPLIDRAVFTAISYFDFFKIKSNTSKMTVGQSGDGYIEVIIRSVTRIVMR